MKIFPIFSVTIIDYIFLRRIDRISISTLNCWNDWLEMLSTSPPQWPFGFLATLSLKDFKRFWNEPQCPRFLLHVSAEQIFPQRFIFKLITSLSHEYRSYHGVSNSDKLLILLILIESPTAKNLRGFRQDLTVGVKKNKPISFGSKGRLKETSLKRSKSS